MRIDFLCPIQFVNKWSRRQKFTIRAIEYVEESISVSLHKQFPRPALVGKIDQNRGFRRVIVEQVMRCELKMPLQLSGVRIQREHAIGVEIIAGPRAAIEIRRRITRAPVQRVEFGVVGSRHPSGAAATQIRIAWPTFRAGLARAWNGPEAPGQLAGLGVEGGKEAAYAIVTPGGADDHFVFDHQRRAGSSVVFVSYGATSAPLVVKDKVIVGT